MVPDPLGAVPRTAPPGVAARRTAVGVLTRVEEGGRSNDELHVALAGSSFDERDRGLVTTLVYGTLRRQRSCDVLAEPFVRRRLDAGTRSAVRLGVYQMIELRVPAHAAVDTAVGAAPARSRSLVNAVLRAVARGLDAGPPDWTTAEALSYPDWIVARVQNEWGDDGLAALAAMNVVQQVPERPDNYRQGLASAWVAAEADGDGLLVDLCAAPGGKATVVVAGRVVAIELVQDRVATLAATVDRLGHGDRISVVRADGTSPPLRAGVAATVLVDAPCSNLGALGRRPEARWRVRPGDVVPLAALQDHLLAAGATLVAPGGVLVHAVCTLTGEETTGVAERFLRASPDVVARAAPPSRVAPARHGWHRPAPGPRHRRHGLLPIPE